MTAILVTRPTVTKTSTFTLSSAAASDITASIQFASIHRRDGQTELNWDMYTTNGLHSGSLIATITLALYNDHILQTDIKY